MKAISSSVSFSLQPMEILHKSRSDKEGFGDKKRWQFQEGQNPSDTTSAYSLSSVWSSIMNREIKRENNFNTKCTTTIREHWYQPKTLLCQSSLFYNSGKQVWTDNIVEGRPFFQKGSFSPFLIPFTLSLPNIIASDSTQITGRFMWADCFLSPPHDEDAFIIFYYL